LELRPIEADRVNDSGLAQFEPLETMSQAALFGEKLLQRVKQKPRPRLAAALTGAEPGRDRGGLLPGSP
jgi:hypothetical protein